MALSVLLANDVAERCYLSEALYWVALCRFPIAYPIETGEDGREYDEWIEEGIDPPYSLETVSREECLFAGLPINPQWEAEQRFEVFDEPDDIKRRIAHTRDEQWKAEMLRSLEETLAYRKRLAAWKSTFKSFLDLHAAKLFVALREGQLEARGKPLPSRMVAPLVRQSVEDEARRHRELGGDQSKPPKQRLEGPRWSRVGWEPIPREFWISKNIVWSHSCAAGDGIGYAFVLAETAQLFKCFPIPTNGQLRQISQIGNGYVLFDEGGKAVNPPSASRGRRPFAWDEFHVEMGKRIKNGVLPEKQEALIVEMQAWCRARWGGNVGRSTLLQKIKPYYDELFRPSEK